MKNKFEKLGSFGAIIAAAACPICFPKLALLGALIGLGTLQKYETFFFYSSHVLIIMALAGHIMSYKRLRNKAILTLAITSSVLFFTSLYIIGSEVLSYAALMGLVVATLWMLVENRRCVRCEE